MSKLEVIRGADQRAQAECVLRVLLIAVLLGALLLTAGCASTVTEPAAEAAVAVEATGQAPAGPAVEALPVPDIELLPLPERHQVALVYSSDDKSTADMAARIGARLPDSRYVVTRIDVDGRGLDEALEDLRTRRGLAAVAVGSKAAEFSRRRLDVPLVFCQVASYKSVLDPDSPIWGVAAAPPLALQLRGWKGIDPKLRHIGLIVGKGNDALVAEARAAAHDAGAEVISVESSSDRETLYLFKRLAHELDGLWLVPDNRILSPVVLRELLGYALSHDVGVLAFSNSLLPWGALISATSEPADVAATVTGVLERVVTGRTDGLPAITPLSGVLFEHNPEAAIRLGLKVLAQTAWVLHEPD